LATEVRKAATSWHSAEVSCGVADGAFAGEVAAVDDGALLAPPAAVPLDPHALVIAAIPAIAAAAFHQADVLTARRFIAVLTVRVPILVWLPVADGISLPGWCGPRIARAG
jgi:hypothetical protein